MSLPITAVGPLKVETNPILMVSPAAAGCANVSAVTPASQNADLISRSPCLRAKEPSGSPQVPLHHNSQQLAMARIIVPIITMTKQRAASSLAVAPADSPGAGAPDIISSAERSPA